MSTIQNSMAALDWFVGEGFLFHNGRLFFRWQFMTLDKGIRYEKLEKALF